MGGHAAGEVASAATIDTMAALDTDQPGADLLSALANAVATANMRLQEMIMSDPATEGMGTTLTALLWSEGHAALCHIGDSRAYLLRGGQFYQLTHDHTLVQSLVDEGRITEDDVATHPQRSLLLRALDGRTLADPDFETYETMVGDRYLLCSDGLSGVVTEQTLHQALAGVRDPDKAALQLVELALKGGGPDNITCIVADVVDTQTAAVPTRVPVLAGAASAGPPEQLRSAARQNSPAGRAVRLRRTDPQTALHEVDDSRDWAEPPRGPGANGYGGPETGPIESPARRNGRPVRPYDDDEDDYGPGARHAARRRWPIVTTLLVVLVVALGGAAFASWQWVQGKFYLGPQNGDVAIFQGVNSSIAGMSLSSPYQNTGVPIAELRPAEQSAIRATVSYGGLAPAQQIVSRLRSEVTACRSAWGKLVSWQQQNVAHQGAVRAYQVALNAYNHANPKPKTKPQPPAAIGLPPATPDPGTCAPAAAFGIRATSLPPGTTNTGATPATAPTGTSTAGATGTARPTATTSRTTPAASRPTSTSTMP
jgi:protein phosphatase